jgi:sugar phosphate isomerase/epimerase
MTSFSRREFLIAGGSLLALEATGASTAQPFFQRTELPLGLQLYTVADDLKSDFDGTLNAISKIGYKAVETAGLLDHSPADWRQASLYIPDRFSLEPLAGEGIGKMLARIGAAITLDDWKWNADYLNAKGAALKRLGLRFAYHNHNFEFAPVDNTTGMALLLQATDPAGTRPNFSLQLDPCEVGQGIIDWKVLIAKAYAANVRQYYVEQEPPFSRPPLESVTMSFKYLNALVA